MLHLEPKMVEIAYDIYSRHVEIDDVFNKAHKIILNSYNSAQNETYYPIMVANRKHSCLYSSLAQRSIFFFSHT